MRVLAVAIAAGGAAVACSSPPEAPPLVVIADPAAKDLVTEALSYVPYPALTVRQDADPAAAIEAEIDLSIAVVTDLDCAECYRLDRAATGIVVHGGAPLGIQYGLAAALEHVGFRFFHPHQTRVPSRPAIDEAATDFGIDQSPEIARRGLHLHTLHPIEGYYAFWEPGADNLADAGRIINWLIANRGNYIQWLALDDIVRGGDTADAWREHTRAILEVAHRRGIETGVGIQLFGDSNLQLAFDLIDDSTDPDPAASMAERYAILLDGLDFDSISLSFGEFFGADPQAFIDSTNLAYEQMLAAAPDARMTATIHVGGSDDQRVEYDGQSMIYYFLVQFADARIIPWIHTVMYYNLFESAGGAYHHADFSEHRAFLLDRLRAGEPVGYHPETAYWIAFDNSVPTYLPLYVRSRWLDLDRLRAEAVALPEHTIFSTGWEWGYWQNDVASLRMSYRLPESFGELFTDMFSAYGPDGGALAELVTELAQTQAEVLIGDELAPYLAGRDVYIELGDEIDIRSQPDRPSFQEVLDMTDSDRADVAAAIDRLGDLAAATERARDQLEALDVPRRDRFIAELRDGLAIDLARIEFVRAAYGAAVETATGGDSAQARENAGEWLDEATAIVARRHTSLHHPRGERLVSEDRNATFYQWGYLKQTHELCFWHKESVELSNALDRQTERVPGCVF